MYEYKPNVRLIRNTWFSSLSLSVATFSRKCFSLLYYFQYMSHNVKMQVIQIYLDIIYPQLRVKLLKFNV
jgi:hypothetical protein